MQYTTVWMILALVAIVRAHVEMVYPPPFRSKHNPHTSDKIDQFLDGPLGYDSQFPCKGYHSDLGTPAGAPIATWLAGATYNFTLEGRGHGLEGGSCQVALSYDKGNTFKVIKSFIGSCPVSNNQSFNFTVPSNAPGSDSVIFGWTHFNKIGNREMYMNCAAVKIDGPPFSNATAPLAGNPNLFVPNVGATSCLTIEGTEVNFPSTSGADVEGKFSGDQKGSDVSFKGDCGPVDTPESSPTETLSSIPLPSSTSSELGREQSMSAIVTTSTGAPEASTSTTLETLVSSSAPVTISSFQSLPIPSKTSVLLTPTSIATGQPSATPSGPPTIEGGFCTPSGALNCINETSFQVCINGAWFVVLPATTGSMCKRNESSTLKLARVMRHGTRLV